MPAKLSKPMQRRIRELYAQGRKKQAIARELDVSRDSVAKYCGGVDEEVSIFQAPAAYLSEEQVRKLGWVADAVRVVTCGHCGKHNPVVGRVIAVECECGEPWVRPGWSVGKPRAMPRRR